jgi:hypothetical protein
MDLTRTDLTGTLAFGTIGVVLIVAAIILIRFLRKPKNQHPMAGAQERNIDQIRAEGGDPLSTTTDRTGV